MPKEIRIGGFGLINQTDLNGAVEQCIADIQQKPEEISKFELEDVEDMIIENEKIKEIFSSLSKCRNLTQVSLSESSFQHESNIIICLAELIATSKSIEHLNLSGCLFGDNLKLLFPAIAKNNSISCLSLAENDINDELFEKILDSIKDKTKLAINLEANSDISTEKLQSEKQRLEKKEITLIIDTPRQRPRASFR